MVRAVPGLRSGLRPRSATAHPTSCTQKVSTETEQELAGMLQIRSIPDDHGYDGLLVHNQAGALPAPALEDLISRVKDTDMAEVQPRSRPRRLRPRRADRHPDRPGESSLCAIPWSVLSAAKTNWGGCGQHVDGVMRTVPASQRCASIVGAHYSPSTPAMMVPPTRRTFPHQPPGKGTDVWFSKGKEVQPH